MTVNPYMMAAGEERVVAERLRAVLASPPRTDMPAPAPPAADLSGGWDVRIQFAAMTSTHTLQLRQRGHEVDGAHKGEFVTRDLTGSVDGSRVSLRSYVGEENGDPMSYTFTGTIAGDTFSGALDMGEYLGATFTATRRAAGRRRG